MLLLKLLYFLFFRWNMWIEKTIPVYIPTHLVISFHKIIHHLLNALELEDVWFYYSRNGLPNCLLLKMIFFLCWNHQHICKECSQKQNTHETSSNVVPVFRATTRLYWFQTIQILPNCQDFYHAISMLITLPRGYEKCPFGPLLSFIHIMYFHIHGIRSRVEQGAPWLQ